ncbi:MAG: hypothetical protein PHH91_08945 [Desulfuromonadaceae bacterium]|nr:hypothetical protein [Desulfuromonadaceae bacterium]
MKKRALAVLCIIYSGIIAGCGSSGSSTNPAATTSVSGKVADGYLVNTTVFLDKNFNYRLDAEEPSAVTDSNGAYSLTIDPTDVGKYPIVAIATKGVTIDKDTNLPVTNTYVLSMHAVAVTPTTGGVSGTASNFISPMSSQIREMMETGKYATMQDAMNELRSKLGLPTGISMMGDYIAANNTAMHTAAQNMATLMGSQMNQVFRSYSSTTGVDVNRYRGMMGTIFNNISSVRGTGTNSQTAMTNLTGTMMTNLSTITSGQPYRNMSSAFRGGTVGWTGSGTTGLTGGTGSGMMR